MENSNSLMLLLLLTLIFQLSFGQNISKKEAGQLLKNENTKKDFATCFNGLDTEYSGDISGCNGYVYKVIVTNM